MRRFMPKALILGLFLCALPCVGLAAEFFSIPDDLPGPPMYLQLAPRFIGPDSTPEWIAIPVYREISGIPLDYWTSSMPRPPSAVRTPRAFLCKSRDS
jgi:hypothetical protein